MANLKTAKVYLEDGSNYETNVSATTTPKNLKEYFVGKMFNMGVYPEEYMVKCIDAELI